MTQAVANPERLPAKVPAARVMKIDEIDRIARSISPQLFGMKTIQEVFTLMMLGQADGIHPITALRRYHIVNGKPSMKADAMLACFLEAGGRVKWLVRTDSQVKAEFSHRDSTVTIDWTMQRAQKAGVTGKDVWRSYPCQMLTARVISEGVRLVMPQIVTGIYTPEEVVDFDSKPEPQQKARQEPPGVDVVDVEPSGKNAKLDEEDIVTRVNHLTGWINDVLNPEHFTRNEETEIFDHYRQQILTDGNGLPETELLKLRGIAYGRWLSCMIGTATQDELEKNYWHDKITKSGLNGASQVKLIEKLNSRKPEPSAKQGGGEPLGEQAPQEVCGITPAGSAPLADGPEWVKTWCNRITAATKIGPAVSIFNDLLEDYKSSPEPDQVMHFPRLFMIWLEHCVSMGGKAHEQVLKKLLASTGLDKQTYSSLVAALDTGKAA